MFGVGASEIAVIVVLALLLLGPDRLPGLVRSLAGAYRELVRMRMRVDATVKDLKRELDSDLNLSQFDTVKKDVAGLIPALRDPLGGVARRLPLDQLREAPLAVEPLPVAAEDDYLSSSVGEDPASSRNAGSPGASATPPANQGVQS
jgi:sec-independent protein translocase protein TatB